MAVPKRRTSKMKQRHRRAANRWKAPHWHECAECGSPVRPHCVCSSCGYYRNRKVLATDDD